MMRIAITLTLSLFFFTFTNAQSADLVNKRKADFDGTTLNKNALCFSLGAGSQSLVYEVNFANTKRSAWSLKAGIGFNQAVFSANSQHVLAGITYLTGRKRMSHFELSTGGIFMFDRQDYRSSQQTHFENESISDFLHLNATGYMGYRYQKPGGHFIFRYGIGYPEISAISFGYAF